MTTQPKELPKLQPNIVAERCRLADQELERLWTDIVSFSLAVQSAGGTAYLVGGAVRDLLWSTVPHDFDLEVHHLGPDSVERLAGTLGKVSSVGRAFGILKIHRDGHEIDISLPRYETKTGVGHRDFSIGIDPEMGVTAAAARRDFTIGAIYLDIVNGKIIDPFDGVADVNERRLRIVNPKSFNEDPLRLLRALQLTARFSLTVSPETLNALQQIVPAMGSLSVERVRQEWEKLVLAPAPSLGIKLGRSTGYFELWHPEISALWTTPQNPRLHPEGDVWNHTLLAIDQVQPLFRQMRIATTSYLPIALAVLAHDFGKPLVTRNVEGIFRDDGHEVAAMTPVENFLQRIGIEEKLRIKIWALIRAHHWMDHIFTAAQRGRQATPGEVRRLIHQIQPASLLELLIVTAADNQGRGRFSQVDGLLATPVAYGGTSWWLEKIIAERLDQPLEPILWGRDLVERHWPIGPAVGEAVRLAEQLGQQGMSRNEILQILDAVPQPNDALSTLRTLVRNEVPQNVHPAARSKE